MRKIKHLLAAVIFVFAFSMIADAQGTTDYRFLEVVDSADEPIAAATVDLQGACSTGKQLTDEKGELKRGLPIGGGDCGSLYDFTISKNGYYSFRDMGLFSAAHNDVYREQFVSDFFRNRDKYKIELLKIPENKAERKIVGGEQLKRELMWAVRDRDAAAVRKLLESGVNPNLNANDLRGVLAPQNLPAVIYAAASGDVETVKEFIRAGVDFRKKDSPARDILLYYLDANPRQCCSNTPPETENEKAALARFQIGVGVLIDAGANLKATTKTGKTALMIAADNGDARTVKTLLDKNLPVNQTDGAGRTALIYATHFNYAQNPNKLEVVETLLKAGANVNLITPDFCGGGGTSALMSAAANSNLVLVKLLLNNKADVNLMCDDGQTALRTAIQFQSYDANPGRYEIIKTLIDAGADVNAADKDGQTNLMFVVNTSTPETVEMLLKNGARINARDKKGETVLMKATSYKTEIVDVLLEHGADPNIVADGDYVSVDGKRAADCETALMQAVDSGATQIIEMLVRHGANVNFACGDGETALTKAAQDSQVETVKKLLESGADAKGAQGHRALEHARQMLREYDWSKEKSAQIIELLEAAGAK